MHETKFICPKCEFDAEIVEIGNIKYLKCTNCSAHFKLSEVLCPICLQQVDMVWVTKNGEETGYTFCRNCMKLNDFRLCLHLGSGKDCRKCSGLGILIQIEEDKYDIHRPTECLGAYIPAEMCHFLEAGKTLGKDRIIQVLKDVYQTKKWPDDLEIRLKKLVKKAN